MESRSHLGNIEDVFTHRASKQEYGQGDKEEESEKKCVCDLFEGRVISCRCRALVEEKLFVKEL